MTIYRMGGGVAGTWISIEWTKQTTDIAIISIFSDRSGFNLLDRKKWHYVCEARNQIIEAGINGSV